MQDNIEIQAFRFRTIISTDMLLQYLMYEIALPVSIEKRESLAEFR